MSPRLRVYLNVALATVVAVGVVVGLTIHTRSNVTQPPVLSGKPPVPPGLSGKIGAEITQIFRTWPHGSINAIQQLGLEYPTSAVVQYVRGFALLWAGYPSDAEAALLLAKKLGTNTIIQGRADNLLHPNYLQPSDGIPYPVFQPTEKSALLDQGEVLQEEGHQESAEKVFARAARLHPDDPQAATGAAVALFDESNIEPSIDGLKQLTKRFPKSQTVHFYLAYLLAWTDQVGAAIDQWEDTVRLGSDTVLGKAAETLLASASKASQGSSG